MHVLYPINFCSKAAIFSRYRLRVPPPDNPAVDVKVPVTSESPHVAKNVAMYRRSKRGAYRNFVWAASFREPISRTVSHYYQVLPCPNTIQPNSTAKKICKISDYPCRCIAFAKQSYSLFISKQYCQQFVKDHQFSTYTSTAYHTGQTGYLRTRKTLQCLHTKPQL